MVVATLATASAAHYCNLLPAAAVLLLVFGM
jgi:hypothetical protein